MLLAPGPLGARRALAQRRRVALRAVVLRAAVRRAGALRAVVLRAAVFRAGAFRAAAFFFAGPRFVAVVLRAVAFLAGARLAAALRAGAGAADFPAAFTRSSRIGKDPRFSLGALAGLSTASLNAFTGVIRAFFEALIQICSPVAGLRPMRAGRSTLTNLANPLIATASPLDTTDVTTSVNPSRTLDTVDRSISL